MKDITGSKNPKWRGGQTTAKDGRVLIYSPTHPFPNWKNYVYRYRLLMEKHLGRYLTKTEVVHHKNGIPFDDRLENLQVMTQSEHAALHFKNVGWSAEYEACVTCHSTERKDKGRGLCRRCIQTERREKLKTCT